MDGTRLTRISIRLVDAIRDRSARLDGDVFFRLDDVTAKLPAINLETKICDGGDAGNRLIMYKCNVQVSRMEVHRGIWVGYFSEAKSYLFGR